jgi:hypothetical protein
MKLGINKEWVFMPYLLIAAVAVARLAISHPYNFVPIFSCLIFFAMARPRREYAIPFLLLMGVDIYVTRIRYGYPLTGDHAVTWLWYLVAILAGGALLRGTSSTSRAVVCSLLASISFFVVSNFAVWAEWGMYAKTWSGLGECYIAALPFFRNSLASEMMASALIFTLAHFAGRWMGAQSTQTACS